MGAHVWAPAYLRDHLLPNFQLSGWSMDWYAGFPMYRFYMVVPALAIVALDIVLPYGVAFKLVAVLGLVTLPLCCWAFGRLARFRYPMPELFAFAGLLFLLDESFSIYGGNLKSTMAGEFSFSIALIARRPRPRSARAGLRTGKYRSWAAIVLALAVRLARHRADLRGARRACVLVARLDRPDRGSSTRVTTGASRRCCSSAWWVGPFLFNHAVHDRHEVRRPPDGADRLVLGHVLPAHGAARHPHHDARRRSASSSCIVRRHLNGAALGVICLALVAGVYLTRDSLPVIGLLWNPRLLPFVYLLRYLLMMVGVVEGDVAGSWQPWRDARSTRRTTLVAGTGAAGRRRRRPCSSSSSDSCSEVAARRRRSQTHDGETRSTQWGPFAHDRRPRPTRSGDGWSRYNFLGYEGRPRTREYHDVVQTMDEHRRGPDAAAAARCGRTTSDNGQYGTTMALMLLPHWTDGCIASHGGPVLRGVGHHAVPLPHRRRRCRKQSSNPVRELRYDNNDAAVGVPLPADARRALRDGVHRRRPRRRPTRSPS